MGIGIQTIFGSGCGTVGKSVTFDSRDPQFESCHYDFLFAVNCIDKTNIGEEIETGNGLH